VIVFLPGMNRRREHRGDDQRQSLKVPTFRLLVCQWARRSVIVGSCSRQVFTDRLLHHFTSDPDHQAVQRLRDNGHLVLSCSRSIAKRRTRKATPAVMHQGFDDPPEVLQIQGSDGGPLEIRVKTRW